MGMPGPFSRSANDEPAYTPVAPNPNPKKCHIEWAYTNGVYTLLQIYYDGCTNYEGIKLLLYAAPLEQIVQQKINFGLDPHFSDGPLLHPIARFEPTDRGEFMGVSLCHSFGPITSYRWVKK